MGLDYDRAQRRRQLDASVIKAIVEAITDARSSYDDRDAETLQRFLDWWNEQEIFITSGGKALERSDGRRLLIAGDIKKIAEWGTRSGGITF